MDDLELLGRYAQEQDQQAFAELVRRHGAWVYAAARRQVGDGHSAEDVTQAVFVLLSRRAGRLVGYRYLGGWLFRAMSYCVKEALRERVRRGRREAEAARMRDETAKAEAEWEQIAPELEAAVGRLGREDREAVLLRFYEQKALAEVGRVLGVSEEAARKRVERAVGKLRERLAAKGVEVEAGSLGAMVLAHAGADGPAGLVQSVMAGMGSGTAGGIAKGAGKMMVLAKMKVAAAGVVVLVASVTGVAWRSGSAQVTGDPTPRADIKLPPAQAGEAVEVLAGAPSLDEVVKGVRAQEDAVRTLYVEGFETTFFRRKLDADKWEKSPQGSRGNAWYVGPLGGKMRVEFSSSVLPWRASAVPPLSPPDGYSVAQGDIGFDGEVSIEVLHASGFLGKLSPNPGVTIQSERNGHFYTPRSPGLTTAISLAWAYRRGSKGERFSDELAEAGRSRKPYVVTRERVDGVELVRLTSSTAFGTSVWLDPQKGYAFAGMHEQYISKPEGRLLVYRREAVTEFAEAAPGLWLPLAGFCEDMDGPDGLVRVEYRAKRIVANDPKFDEAVLRPAIPKGYVVFDTRTGPVQPPRRQAEQFANGKAGDVGPEKRARAQEMQLVRSLCALWANEHDRRWPARLEELKGFTRYVQPDETKGWDQWVYYSPGTGGDQNRAVLFEKMPAFADGELVVFADGFVEFVRDRG